MNPPLTSLITLTTDFGTGSPYVAQMKAAILCVNPRATIVDVTHAVAPQDVWHGAVVLEEVTPRFPPGTIHVAVVDPTVGTGRRIVLARFGEQTYVAPDNGLLGELDRRGPPELLFELTERRFWAPEVSPTFHGRDIMAPVAGHLSLGIDPRQLGQPLEKLTPRPSIQPVVSVRGIVGTIRSIDSFGNLTTDITAEMLRQAVGDAHLEIRCGETTISGHSLTYADVSPLEAVAIIGSGGRLELAVRGGNAARRWQAGVGQRVEVRW